MSTFIGVTGHELDAVEQDTTSYPSRDRIHSLKILPHFYEAVVSGQKTFEVRKDDRGFQMGDLVFLREFDGEEYTGRITWANIAYIVRSHDCPGALNSEYCVFGLAQA